MSILYSISIGLESRSVNRISINENLELKNFLKIKFLGEISNNWPNNLLGINVYKTLEFFW